MDVLGKVWELSDLDQDGQLDRDEFLIALQLISKAKEGVQMPDQLPPSLLPFKVRHSSIPTTTSANSLAINMSLVNETKVYNHSFHIISYLWQKMSTIRMLHTTELKPWVVTFEEKSKSDITFMQLDTDKDGFVNGAECKEVFLKTGLSPMILANIWYLIRKIQMLSFYRTYLLICIWQVL